MNHGPLIFLGILFALASSWFGMVVSPQLQFGGQQQVSAGPAVPRYPVPRSGSAQAGREVYRANGCVYCHTQQIRQAGAHFDVVLAGSGTNKEELVRAVLNVNPGLRADGAAKLVEAPPKPVLQGLTYRDADLAAKRLAVADAKVNVVLVPTGPDIERGWGRRSSVAQDYLYDQPVLLGNLRLGPDLTNISRRQTNAAWHFLHLYDPKLVSTKSTMPRYPFLFEKRRIGQRPSPEALTLPPSLALEPQYEIIPKPEARELVAYLLSLQSDVPLFEAPLPPEPQKSEEPSTNQPPAAASFLPGSSALISAK